MKLLTTLVNGALLMTLALAGKKCNMENSYPPPAETALPWFDIDLDVDPYDRWNGVVDHFKPEMTQFIEFVFDHLQKVLDAIMFVEIKRNANAILASMPNGYGNEIAGIASRANIDLDKLIVYNMAYELMGFCTSIVGEDSNGKMFHGRNLDFGLYPAFNWTDFQWDLTSELRPLLFNANMKKDGKVLYKAAYFAGYIGLLTGVRQNAMTLTVDSRYDSNLDKYMFEYFSNPDDGLAFLTLTTRYAMEGYDNYDDAVAYFKQVPMMAPAYIIIGGVNAGEGAVFSLGPNNTVMDYWPIAEGYPKDNADQAPFFVLETNYDHWDDAPWFDDRRDAGVQCVEDVGQEGLAIPTLFNVLTGKPTRNRLTTYTSVMSCADGHLESYIQHCDDINCSPW